VRLLSSSPLTAGFIRISIGDEKQMNILFETIDSWQKNA
jgi:histidinol-phosphate/aromatic aminotransferase/cobyric acid decarboxylase-like protein